ncbi:MAG: hypothetical protein JST15_12080 [Bacteroidetes bacterium]|nr:hypothetical protein [Bacteroidota bacterium]
MKNKLTGFISENFLTMFLMIMILPFIILFFFNHPSADDWGLAENTKIMGFFNAQVHYYKSWTGKYFSNAVLSYNPVYFRSMFGYKIVTLLLMLLFIYVLFALISELTKKVLNLRERILLTLSVFFMYMYAMPSLSQSFYWLTASVVYQTGIMMIMIFLLLYAKITRPGGTSSHRILIFLSVLLLIAISGCSEMSMVTGVLMISLLVICKLINEKKITAVLILFSLTTAISSYVLLSAPGNSIRGSLYPDSHQLIQSLMTSFSTMTDLLISWIFISPLIFITILITPVIFKFISGSDKKPVAIFINPVYVLITFLFILFVLIFTPVWSLGRPPFSRTINIIYFVFLIGWFYNVMILIYYFSRKFNFSSLKVPGYVYVLSMIIVVLFLFKKNNVKNAYADLLRGGAVKYNNELNYRYDFISKSANDSLIVPDLVNKPRTIFLFDISSDPASEFNSKYAHYFGKKYIAVLKSDTLKNE